MPPSMIRMSASQPILADPAMLPDGKTSRERIARANIL